MKDNLLKKVIPAFLILCALPGFARAAGGRRLNDEARSSLVHLTLRGEGYDLGGCSGTIISSHEVLTARHCVGDGDALFTGSLNSVRIQTRLGTIEAKETFYIPLSPYEIAGWEEYKRLSTQEEKDNFKIVIRSFKDIAILRTDDDLTRIGTPAALDSGDLNSLSDAVQLEMGTVVKTMGIEIPQARYPKWSPVFIPTSTPGRIQTVPEFALAMAKGFEGKEVPQNEVDELIQFYSSRYGVDFIPSQFVFESTCSGHSGSGVFRTSGEADRVVGVATAILNGRHEWFSTRTCEGSNSFVLVLPFNQTRYQELMRHPHLKRSSYPQR